MVYERKQEFFNVDFSRNIWRKTLAYSRKSSLAVITAIYVRLRDSRFEAASLRDCDTIGQELLVAPLIVLWRTASRFLLF